jgi:glutamate synthase (ferredoxin)
MTGGVVVVLGSVGRNVGAGMTGGLAYFLDEDGSFAEKVNKDIVKIQRISTSAGEGQLKNLIEAHLAKTSSAKAKAILDNWESYLGKFWQAVPPSEANAPETNPDAVVEEEKTLTSVQ